MTEIETTAVFPEKKNADYFEYLLSQEGVSNRFRVDHLTVTVTYDGHGTRLIVHDKVKQCLGTVSAETVDDDD